MLVLSRRTNEEIVFANLGITVKLLGLRGKSARLGISAPPDVKILRTELARHGTTALGSLALPDRLSQQARHALKNQLNTASLAMHLARQQLAAGNFVDADHSLDKALSSLAKLDREVANLKARTERGRDPKSHRLLLVEDDANERELLAGVLRMSGYEVATADDGGAALEHLHASKHRPDAVLLDMRLPRISGRETICQIRRNPEYRNLKVFAVTGSDQAEVGVTIGPDGVDRWFSKPINPEQLTREIEREAGSFAART
jgi:carbon storage regulator CsrA